MCKICNKTHKNAWFFIKIHSCKIIGKFTQPFTKKYLKNFVLHPQFACHILQVNVECIYKIYKAGTVPKQKLSKFEIICHNLVKIKKENCICKTT